MVSKKNDRFYLRPMLSGDEVWDIGFSQSNSDFFVTVDDDFEIIDPKFITDMLAILESKDNLGMISTNRTSEAEYFDRYSQRKILAKERNDTWFCMYKKETKLVNISHQQVDYFVKNNGEKIYYDFKKGDWRDYIQEADKQTSPRVVYDSAAYLQEQIRKKYTHKIIALSDISGDYEKMYIHYAAFSKNTEIDSKSKAAIYRYLSHKKLYGFIILPKKINSIISKIASRIQTKVFPITTKKSGLNVPISDLD